MLSYHSTSVVQAMVLLLHRCPELSQKVQDTPESPPGVKSHGNPLGKPWESHGKTMGKPWENPWEIWESHGNPQGLSPQHAGLLHLEIYCSHRGTGGNIYQIVFSCKKTIQHFINIHQHVWTPPRHLYFLVVILYPLIFPQAYLEYCDPDIPIWVRLTWDG